MKKGLIATVLVVVLVTLGIKLDKVKARDPDPYCSTFCTSCYWCFDPPLYEPYCCELFEYVYDGYSDVECIWYAMEHINTFGEGSECEISRNAQ